MRKAFTLLELLVVMVIVGIMATIGLQQYFNVVERSRGSEARQVLGQLRTVCGSLYMGGSSVAPCTGVNITNLSLSDGTNGTLPSSLCADSHYFRYNVSMESESVANFSATRCAVGTGKLPGFGSGNRHLYLVVDYANQSAFWDSPNGY
jgi:prepilin-type N-terminal cleavage/methylation domain-containing protein